MDLSFSHSSFARGAGWRAQATGKPLASASLRMAVFAVLLRVVRSRSPRARACAGPRRHALEGCRGRAGVRWCVAACGALCRSCCHCGQCGPVWASVVLCVRVRREKRDRTHLPSCARVRAGRGCAARRRVLLFCAVFGAVCHWRRTALQPAWRRACGGRDAASTRCCGRVRARELP